MPPEDPGSVSACRWHLSRKRLRGATEAASSVSDPGNDGVISGERCLSIMDAVLCCT